MPAYYQNGLPFDTSGNLIVNAQTVAVTGLAAQSFLWSGATTTAVTGASAALTLVPSFSTIAVTAGSGVTSATVRIEASNDGSTWAGVATVSLTAPGTANVPVAVPYVNLRANVLAVSGGSVSATATAGTTPLTFPPGTTVGVNSPLAGIPAPAWQIVSASAIPIILPSSGTIGNNGALSGIVALTGQYNCWMYFPANAIATGVAAGLYYVEMSSTSAGTIYNNVLTAGQTPYLPGTGSNPAKVPFVTTGPGAYTQTITSTTQLTLPVIGGSMGANGQLRLMFLVRGVNNANNKAFQAYWDGNLISNDQFSAQANMGVTRHIRNAGVTNLQFKFDHAATGQYSDVAGVSGTVSGDFAVDTTVTKNITFQSFMGNAATDWVGLFGYTLELLYQP